MVLACISNLSSIFQNRVSERYGFGLGADLPQLEMTMPFSLKKYVILVNGHYITDRPPTLHHPSLKSGEPYQLQNFHTLSRTHCLTLIKTNKMNKANHNKS